jgi:hypothetical protein
MREEEFATIPLTENEEEGQVRSLVVGLRPSACRSRQKEWVLRTMIVKHKEASSDDSHPLVYLPRSENS